tara:strand:+ start:230 stop:1336 length:1107 start_codon:yes stop_codon:yes gene_type:complete
MADYWDRYRGMLEEATPLWSGPEDYDAWREKTLQNKQPWGMVPLAEQKIGYGDDWYTSDWDEEGARSSGIYTDPRNAGLEGLFAENPELNWQNPSNKMFPWEPNYAAIEMGDRWMDRHMQGEQEMGNRMGIFDASVDYGEQSDPALATNWGGDAISVNVDRLKEKAERGGYDWQDYFDYGILPHELGHDLSMHEDITGMLPYELPKKGINPMTGDPEKSPQGWEHDLLYSRDPMWWKHHGSRPMTDSSGTVWNNLSKRFALDDKSAMNQMALQSIGRASVTGADMPSKQSFWNRESYAPPPVGTPGVPYNVGSERAGPARGTYQRAEPKTYDFPGSKSDTLRLEGGWGATRPRGTERFSTGGIVSLVI